jgi:hypothetical protein
MAITENTVHGWPDSDYATPVLLGSRTHDHRCAWHSQFTGAGVMSVNEQHSLPSSATAAPNVTSLLPSAPPPRASQCRQPAPGTSTSTEKTMFRDPARRSSKARPVRGPNDTLFEVRRVKALRSCGCKSRPATGSLRPVAIGAAVEVTKPSKPSVQRVAPGDLATRQAVT